MVRGAEPRITHLLDTRTGGISPGSFNSKEVLPHVFRPTYPE